MPNRLGKLLSEQRKLKGLTLREVENETKISNGYLNLLENGKVANPSPNILYKLAEFYYIEYADLLEAAGYASKGIPKAKKQSEIAFSVRKNELNEEELEALKKYFKFLKSESKK